jgi:hypothetical protein
VWWNYGRRRWAKGRHKTPAVLRGVCGRLLRVADVLEARLFATRRGLPERWRQYYDAAIRTRALAINRRHDLKYAY